MRDEIWRKANYRLSKQPSSSRMPRHREPRNDFSTWLSKRGKIARLYTERAMKAAALRGGDPCNTC
jgi:hypothetical protein